MKMESIRQSGKGWIDMSHFLITMKVPIRKSLDDPKVLRSVLKENIQRLADGWEGSKFTIKKQGIQVGKAKRKGTAYEKKIGNILGMWWWGKPFRHQPGSGAWDKLAKDGQIIAPGDIVVPKESGFPFCVECKKRKQLLDVLNSNSDLYTEDWWGKCSKDAATCGRMPLLVFGANNCSDYVVLEYNLNLEELLIHHNVNPIVVKNGGASFVCNFLILKLVDFITVLNPNYMFF